MIPLPTTVANIHFNTDVAAARRIAIRLAEDARFNEHDVSNVSIVATELATNLLKHGGGGEMLMRREGKLLELASLDRGSGIQDAAQCFNDGYSTAGSPGTGMGAIRRLARFCDVYSSPEGTAVLAQMGDECPNGIVNVPYPGESHCGDSWSIDETPDRLRVLIADGLGHGPDAAKASAPAVELASEPANRTPVDLMKAIHLRLRSTRGAAASAADIPADRRSVEFAGIGNVVGVIVPDALSRRQMISVNGTLGHEMRTARQFTYPLENDALVVLHSDGLTANWSLDRYPGLFSRHPALIASILFRDFRRTRDDATVVVVRTRAPQ